MGLGGLDFARKPQDVAVTDVVFPSIRSPRQTRKLFQSNYLIVDFYVQLRCSCKYNISHRAEPFGPGKGMAGAVPVNEARDRTLLEKR